MLLLVSHSFEHFDLMARAMHGGVLATAVVSLGDPFAVTAAQPNSYIDQHHPVVGWFIDPPESPEDVFSI